MLLEKEENRKKRFKAMLQYLILREACEFKGNNAVYEEKAFHARESAKKILKEMKLKFYDLFVEDDLVEGYSFFEEPGQNAVRAKKNEFITQIQDKISDKINLINAQDPDDKNKQDLKDLKKKFFDHQ